jgi:hypothetical protein
MGARQLQNAQDNDLLIGSLKRFLATREQPYDPNLQALLQSHKKDSFIEDRLVWK